MTHAERERARRLRCIEQKRCVRCANDAAPNRRLCVGCAESMRQRYYDRIKEELCARCGCEWRRPEATTCGRCGREQSERVMRRLASL